MTTLTSAPMSVWQFQPELTSPTGNNHAQSRKSIDTPPDQQRTSTSIAPIPKTVGFSFVNVAHPDQARGTANKRTIRSHVAKVQHSKAREFTASRNNSQTKVSNRRRKAVPVPAIKSEISDTQCLEAPAVSSGQSTLSRQSSITDSVHQDDDVEEIIRPVPGPNVNQNYQRCPSSMPESMFDESDPYNNPLGLSLRTQSRLFGGRDDPFRTYPVPFIKGLDSVVDYYAHNIAVNVPFIVPARQPGLLRSKWIPLAMTDPACFYMLVLTAASHRNSVQPTNRQKPNNLLQLKSLALRAINHSLQDRNKQLSDATIGAVIKMASYEACFGDTASYTAHMAGLSQLVRMRGGLSRLGMDGLLERLLLWVDVNSAALLGINPQFDPAGDGTLLRHPQVITPYADWS